MGFIKLNWTEPTEFTEDRTARAEHDGNVIKVVQRMTEHPNGSKQLRYVFNICEKSKPGNLIAVQSDLGKYTVWFKHPSSDIIFANNIWADCKNIAECCYNGWLARQAEDRTKKTAAV